MVMKNIEIWCDGSALGNGKDGARCGAGIVLSYNGVLKELSIPLPNYKTNNQSELYAACAALEALSEPCNVKLYTDSSYVQQGITTWLQGWKRRGWVTANKGAVKNRELWERLDSLIQIHNVEFIWVKGHADNERNNKADELAVRASMSLKEG